MNIKIFTNEALKKEDIDFTQWETFNGDYVKIAEVGASYIERCLDMLAYFMQRYPKHVNYGIWKQYVYVLERELVDREKVYQFSS